MLGGLAERLPFGGQAADQRRSLLRRQLRGSIRFDGAPYNENILPAGFPFGVLGGSGRKGGALYFLVQLGQLPAEGTGAVAQLRQQCGQRLPQAVRRFIKNEGMRQAGDSLQGSLPLSFFDGQKALEQKPPGG